MLFEKKPSTGIKLIFRMVLAVLSHLLLYKMMVGLYVTFLVVLFGGINCLEEGGCGRFEYEYKVLENLYELRRNQTELQNTVSEQRKLIVDLTASVEDRKFGGSSTYVRWGRTACPGNGTELVYEGYAGGSHYTHSGAAVDYLCLPRDPNWGHYEPATQNGGFVYGAEYEYTQRASSHSFFDSQTSKLVDNTVPCAVCRSTRSSVLMVPAKNQCHSGWTHEYHGYLSAGYNTHAAASEYVCVDIEAEYLNGGKTTNHDGKVFYFVEGRCGSLPCPPYVNGRELTCVVCTK